MRPKIIRMATYGVADPNGISTTQTPAAGGIQELTITGATASGGIATMVGQARQVVITTAADETGVKFIVAGTDNKGNYLAEIGMVHYKCFWQGSTIASGIFPGSLKSGNRDGYLQRIHAPDE